MKPCAAERPPHLLKPEEIHPPFSKCMSSHCQSPHTCRLRDEHTLRARAESSLEAAIGEAAACKEKLQEATAGQAEAARLAGDLESERSLHKEAKSQVASLESR